MSSDTAGLQALKLGLTCTGLVFYGVGIIGYGIGSGMSCETGQKKEQLNQRAPLDQWASWPPFWTEEEKQEIEAKELKSNQCEIITEGIGRITAASGPLITAVAAIKACAASSFFWLGVSVFGGLGATAAGGLIWGLSHRRIAQILQRPEVAMRIEKATKKRMAEEVDKQYEEDLEALRAQIRDREDQIKAMIDARNKAIAAART